MMPPATDDAAGIDAVLIDVGGVACAFDPDHRLSQLAQAMNTTPYAVTEAIFDSGFDVECDTGIHTEAAVYRRFQALGFAGSIESLRRLWVSAFVPVSTVLDTARALREHGIKVISVTDNGPVLRAVIDDLLPDDAFDAHVFSCEVGATKPDPEIFRYALDLSGAQASRTVFLDDSPQNVRAARNLGLQAETVNSGAELVSALHHRGLP